MTPADEAIVASLPPIPCMAPVPKPNRTVIDEHNMMRLRRVCTLPNGHTLHGIRCDLVWIDEHVDRAVAS